MRNDLFPEVFITPAELFKIVVASTRNFVFFKQPFGPLWIQEDLVLDGPVSSASGPPLRVSFPRRQIKPVSLLKQLFSLSLVTLIWRYKTYSAMTMFLVVPGHKSIDPFPSLFKTFKWLRGP
jgi:hypothetical protein